MSVGLLRFASSESGIELKEILGSRPLTFSCSEVSRRWAAKHLRSFNSGNVQSGLLSVHDLAAVTHGVCVEGG